jgi:hypothetical protein
VVIYVGGPRLVAGAMLVTLCSLIESAEAQEWKLDTSLSQQFMYTDNLLLRNDNEIDTFGSITTPALTITRTSPTLDVALNGRFEFAEYFNHSGFDSQDQFVELTSRKAFSERSSARLDGYFTRDTSLRSEMDETGRFLDDPVRYISWNLRPSWSYFLTPIDEVAFRGSYKENTYDGSEKTDYQYFGGSVDYSHRLSEIDRATASIGYFRYVPDQSDDSPTDVLSLLVGYAYEPSERLDLNGAIGIGYSMRNPDDGSSQDGVGLRLKFNGRYELSEVTDLRFFLSHDSEPSSDGEQTTRNRVGFGANHKLTPLVSFGLNLDYVDNYDYIGTENDATSAERDSRYASVRPSLSWLVYEDLSLVAEYRFRYKLYDDDDDAAIANSVFLTLKYDLPTWAGSGY